MLSGVAFVGFDFDFVRLWLLCGFRAEFKLMRELVANHYETPHLVAWAVRQCIYNGVNICSVRLVYA